MAKKVLTDLQRFKNNIKIVGKCWEWQLAKDRDGYGWLKIGSLTDNSKKMVYSHRWSCEHFNGRIPKGYQVDHLCENKCCVNPAHLEAVTSLENQKRSWERGRVNPSGWHHTKSTKNKIRQKAIGREVSLETRAKMSEAQKQRERDRHGIWR